jgi:mitogen-activated protein kinase organizer 1
VPPELEKVTALTGPGWMLALGKYEAHGYSVLDIAVTADNARFASVGGDRQVFLWGCPGKVDCSV